MKKFLIILIMSLIMCGLLASTSLIVSAAGDEELLGSGMVVYMQMGGTEGDPSTLARTNGARAADLLNNIQPGNQKK